MTRKQWTHLAMGLVTVLVAGALSLGLGGTATAATSSATATTHISVSSARQVSVHNPTVSPMQRSISFPGKKLAAFAGCVFGTGIPIGAAIAIAITPAAWAWVVGAGPLPASMGGTVVKYINTVKSLCRYALF